MFSKDLFRYLVDSKKYLLIFIVLVSLLNGIGNSIKGLDLLLQGVFAIGLSFLMPALVFYHVHDKRAVDSYFSLPVSRKKMLVTNVCFCTLTVFVTIAIGVVCFAYKWDRSLNVSIVLLEMALASFTLVVFNSTLYLLGNDVVDGIVMMGAYTFLPAAIFVVINGFYYSFVAGRMNSDLSAIRFLSPIYMSAEMLLEIVDEGKVVFLSVIGLTVMGIIFFCLLQRSYVDRNVERAGSRSDEFFSYPLVINLYLVISMFSIITLFGFEYRNIGDFMKDCFILYVLLFAVFAAAQFVYKRKIYFDYRLPSFFVIVMIASILFGLLCRGSKGFGLSERYEKASGNDACTINIWDASAVSDLKEYVREETGDTSQIIQIFIQIPADERNRTAMSETTAELIDKYRKMAIEDFYKVYDEDSITTDITIVEKESGTYYNYRMIKMVEFADILSFAKDPCVQVVIATEKDSYRMDREGKLLSYTW